MPAPVAFTSSTDKGFVLAVNQWVKDPTLVQSVMANMLDKQFIADEIFRDGGAAPSGVIRYTTDESLFANGDIEVVAEYGEIPVIQGTDGTPQAVFTRRFAGALMVSEQMRTRNSVDIITKRLRQIKNTFVKAYDDMFMAALFGAPIPTYAAPMAWTNAEALIRFDLAKAGEVVIGAKDVNGNELLFEPNTLIVNPLRASAMTYNNDIGKVFRGNIASEAPTYKGEIQNTSGYKILKSHRIPVNKAVLLERKTVGFISDERALRTTPMYEQRERETWRSDTSRVSACAVDQPKAAVILTGI